MSASFAFRLPRRLSGRLVARLLPPAAGKELRALLPASLLLLAIPLALLWDGREAGISVAWFLYCLWCAVTGALSFGHEFDQRTLAGLLAQPLERRVVWRRKMAVLGAVLLTGSGLAALAVVGARPDDLPGELLSPDAWQVGWLPAAPVLFALCTSPCLALMGRSSLITAVTSIAFPLAGAGLFTLFGWACAGFDDAVFEAAGNEFALAGFVAFGVYCLGGYVLGYSWFLRMDVLDGPGRPLALPRWLTGRISGLARSVAPGKPGVLGRLAAKELHLHQASYFLAAAYGVIWLVTLLAKMLWHETKSELFANEALIYAVLLALFTGATVCAEERGSGTLEWHLALPISARVQWCVKAAVAFTITFALGVILPGLLVAVAPQPGNSTLLRDGPFALVVIPQLAATLFMIVAVAAYASATARSPITAALRAVGLAAGLLYLAICCLSVGGTSGISNNWLFGTLQLLVGLAQFGWESLFRALNLDLAAIHAWIPRVWPLVAAASIPLLLALGFSHFRRTDAQPARVWRQLVAMGLYTLLVSVVWSGLNASLAGGSR